MRWQGASPNRTRGRKWRRIRAEVLAEEPFCRWCIERDEVTIDSRSVICDHITPLAEGGTDDRGNLAGMCERHHDEKTAAEAARALGRAPPAAPIAARGIAASGRPTSPDHPWNARRNTG